MRSPAESKWTGWSKTVHYLSKIKWGSTVSDTMFTVRYPRKPGLGEKPEALAIGGSVIVCFIVILSLMVSFMLTLFVIVCFIATLIACHFSKSNCDVAMC